MTKTATQETMSPYSLAPGGVIRASDVQAVHEAQNEARCNTVCNLASIQAADVGGSALSPVGTDGIAWPATGTVEVYRGWVWIDADVDALYIQTLSVVSSGVGSAVVTVGSGSVTQAHSVTGAVSGTLATSSSGVGWQLVTVDLQQDSGDPSSNTIEYIQIRTVPITVTALPNPV